MTIKQLIILGIGIIVASMLISCSKEVSQKHGTYQVETKIIYVEDQEIVVIKGSDNNWYLKQHTYMHDIYIPYNSSL